jgi:hypothetical protein
LKHEMFCSDGIIGMHEGSSISVIFSFTSNSIMGYDL